MFVICGVLKGKQKYFVFCCLFIWIHLISLLCLGPWKMNFGSFLVELHITLPFFLCRQLRVYVKLVSHLPAPFVGCASPLGSPSWKKGKLTDYLRSLSEIRGWRPLWALPAPHTALWPRSLGSACLLPLPHSSAFTAADSGAGSSPFSAW